MKIATCVLAWHLVSHIDSEFTMRYNVKIPEVLTIHVRFDKQGGY